MGVSFTILRLRVGMVGFSSSQVLCAVCQLADVGAAALRGHRTAALAPQDSGCGGWSNPRFLGNPDVCALNRGVPVRVDLEALSAFLAEFYQSYGYRS